MKMPITVEEFRGAGRVVIRSKLKPLSLQAIGARKRALVDAIAKEVATSTTGIFTGDVEITIQWFIQEDERYRTHLVADLDNIVKPLLDAITGPKALLIDDNQVQSIRVSWLDPGYVDTSFILEVQALDRSEIYDRTSLVFVEFAPTLCFPVNVALIPHIQPVTSGIRRILDHEAKLIGMGLEPSTARVNRPIQRFFPKARLAQFQVVAEADVDGFAHPAPHP